MTNLAHFHQESTSARRGLSIRLACLLALLGGVTDLAKAQKPASSIEIAVTFTAQSSIEVNAPQNFWAEGGALEMGANAFRGFGLAASVAAVHTTSVGTTGTPLSLVIATFGPRYRWHDSHRLSVFGEGLVGEANGYHSLFPSPFGAQADANSVATQVRGGLDLRLGRHVSARVLNAGWLRTQFPNSTSDVQNNLVLGAGVVFRSAR